MHQRDEVGQQHRCWRCSVSACVHACVQRACMHACTRHTPSCMCRGNAGGCAPWAWPLQLRRATMCMCACARVRACGRAGVRACGRAGVHASSGPNSGPTRPTSSSSRTAVRPCALKSPHTTTAVMPSAASLACIDRNMHRWVPAEAKHGTLGNFSRSDSRQKFTRRCFGRRHTSLLQM